MLVRVYEAFFSRKFCPQGNEFRFNDHVETVTPDIDMSKFTPILDRCRLNIVIPIKKETGILFLSKGGQIMNSHNKMLAIIICWLITVSACSTSTTYRGYPKGGFEDVKDAYHNVEETPPENSHLELSYPVSYEDAFQAVTSSLTLANLFLVDINRDTGVILAHHLLKTDPRYAPSSKYFYRIYVKEIGPEETAVDIQSRVQSNCGKTDIGMGLHIASLGLLALYDDSPSEEEFEEICIKYLSQPNWTNEGRSDRTTLEKVHQLTRINLVKAGLI